MIFLNFFGTKYGSWSKIPQGLLGGRSLIYSFGAGEDISCEFNISGLLDSEIHIFDPTPRSIEHYDFCKNLIVGQNINKCSSRFGGGDPKYCQLIMNSNANLKKIFFHKFGIYNDNKIISFYYPKNKEHVSLSIDNLQRTKDFINLQVKRIDKIVDDLLHRGRQIDLLKLNIEGAEIPSLLYMLESTNIKPTCICVKFELIRDKKTKENIINFRKLKKILYRFYDEVYCDEIGYNYTFLIK